MSNRLDSAPLPAKTESWQMFNRVAKSYDFLNRLLSLGIDTRWRRKLARALPVDARTVIDLGTGTGDQALAIAEVAKPRLIEITAVDPAEHMLALGREKPVPGVASIDFRLGNAMDLQFVENQFDAVTMSFGIRNVPEPQKALQEMCRVLRPGGRVLILEFGLPSFPPLRWAYLLYFRHILPRIGGWLSGDLQAYRYLNQTVEEFPYAKSFTDWLHEAGFRDAKFTGLTFGVAFLYEATKPMPTFPVASAVRHPHAEQGWAQVLEELQKVPVQRHGPLYRRSLAIRKPSFSAPQWLEAMSEGAKFAFTDRDRDIKVSACGEVWKSSLDQSWSHQLGEGQAWLQEAGGVLCLGGAFFQDEHQPGWVDFPRSSVWAPQWYLREEQGRIQLVVQATSGEQLIEALTSASHLSWPSAPESTPQILAASLSPQRDHWLALVEGLLRTIAQGPLEKVVLARESQLTLSQPIDLWALLARLREALSPGFVFLYQPKLHGPAFIGLSPEMLFRRSGAMVETEAVAGTRVRPVDPVEDEAMSLELLADTKDGREHQLVAEMLQENLGQLCQSWEYHPTERVMRLTRLMHRLTRYRGILLEGVDSGRILQELHPTPAVAGWPTASALSWLAEKEPMNRGWYAGALGIMHEQSTIVTVAIRSALVHQTKLSLYAGAGVVEGSVPEAEWDEVERKTEEMLCWMGLK